MKRILIVISLLCCFLLVSTADAQRRLTGPQRGGSSGAGDPLRTPTGGGGGAATCSTVVDYSSGSTTDTVCGSAAANYFRAYSFTTPADGGNTIKSITLNLWKTGSPGSDLSAKICTDNAAKPSTTCTNATAAITAASVSHTASPGGSYKFSWTGYSYSQSTRYWLVMSATVVDASNRWNMRYNMDGVGGEIVTASVETPISWSNTDSTSYGTMLVSQCE